MNSATWPPPHLCRPNNPLWLWRTRAYSDSADADSVTIKKLRRSLHPIRVRFTRAEALALIESGELRPYHIPSA